jgi:hypothetical protein
MVRDIFFNPSKKFYEKAIIWKDYCRVLFEDAVPPLSLVELMIPSNPVEVRNQYPGTQVWSFNVLCHVLMCDNVVLAALAVQK